MKKCYIILILTAFLLPSLLAEWQDGHFTWEKSEKIAPGVCAADWGFTRPRKIRIFALRIDLRTPGLQFHVTGKAPEYGYPMPEDALFTVRTRRQTTVDFFNDLLQKEHRPMVAAINGAPWKPWVAPWNHPFADCMGLLISDGDVVLPSNGIKPSLIIYRDGRAEMKLLKPDADLSGIRHAISGFFFVLEKGVPAGNKKNLAPRTGIGLSADRRYMYWIVADGRQEKYSQGMTVYEVGTFLRYLGADTGLNMDGGGSSTFVLLRQNKAVMLNKQPKNSIRKVGSSIGISIARP